MSQSGLLSEHEAPEIDKATTSPGNYAPTDEEKKAIKLVNSLLSKAKAHKKKYDEPWPDYYKMFRGKQWKEQRPSYRHSEVINMVFQHIQSCVPMMTDSRPRLSFLPTEPSDFPLSEILNKASESDWESKNWQMVLTEALFESHILGTAIGEMSHDPDGNDGVGDKKFCTVDPYHFFPDPEAKDINDGSCRYVITAVPTEVTELKRQYPQKAKYIKADLADLSNEADRTELDNVKYRSTVNNRMTLEGSKPGDPDGKEKALKITLWLKPNSGLDKDEIEETEEPELDEQGQPVLGPDGMPVVSYVQKLKHPRGRKICIAGGVLLDDGENPYEDRKFPFAKLINYHLPREFWGLSEVEQLQGPQRVFNKLVSFALDVLTLMGNPVWVVDSTSGVDTDNLFNRPGLVIEKEPGSEVSRQEGVQLQPYVLQLIDRMKTWFDDVSGTQDVSRGSKPEGITAASAINSLQESAKTRIRLKSRNMDAFLQDVGQLWLSRTFQFCSAPQMYRLTNNQNVNQYFKMHIEAVQDEMGQDAIDAAGNPVRKAVVTEYAQDPMTNQYQPGEAMAFQAQGKFDVRCSMGSSLPFAKEEKISLAKFLMEAGAIDEPELLEAVDYPNKEAVWERVKQRKMEKMQQEQAMATPPGGAPPPPAA